jgi:suppressor for copper-sensitivity B
VLTFNVSALEVPVQADLTPVKYNTNSAILALEFHIPDSWKVYSNDPGDTGLPIDLSFEGSTNVETYTVDWPPSEVVVEMFGDEELHTNVYKKDVIIPIYIKPLDSSKQIDIKAKLSFGACEKVCIGLNKDFVFTVTTGFLNERLNSKLSQQCVSLKNTEVQQSNTPSILVIALFALAGGFILNLMPCVLPVLALKLLNIVKYAGLDKKQIRTNLVATSFGIVGSFIILASITIILKVVGVNFGWGFQFQEPWFLIFIAMILVVFSSNLWGDFEINLPQWMSEKLAKHRQTHSINNSIAAGAFATLLATPCTAPFLSVSVAYALSQTEMTILLIYTIVGVGMASPYLALALTPKTLKFLPKPGKWMVNLKKFFAILLILTLVWIFYVLYFQINAISLTVLICSLLLLKFFLVKKIHNKMLSSIVILLSISLAFTLPILMEKNIQDKKEYHNSLWEPYNVKKLEEYIRDNRTVVIDITAEWCITCKVNKLLVLEQDDVIHFLKNNNVIMMRGDYTNKSAEIEKFLVMHNRYGIPLDVVYGPKNKSGIVLPEILTKDSLINAIKSVSDLSE